LVLPAGTVLLHYFENKSKNYELFTFTLLSAVRSVGVLFVLILEYSARNIPRFLDDVHIVEALNKPVDDSGSEGAKLFVNMGNVFWADFCSLNFHCFLINC
jgi:hypothetical protein